MEKSKPGYKGPEKIAPLIIPRHPNTPLGEGIDCTPNKNITSKHQTLRYGMTAGCLRVLGEGIWFDAPTQLWGKKKPRKNRGPTGSGICSMFTIYSKLNLHLFCSTLEVVPIPISSRIIERSIFSRASQRSTTKRTKGNHQRNGRSAFLSYQMIL